MKQKILMMFLLTALFSVALVSAFTISTSTPVALTKTNNQTSFTLTPTIQTGQAINITVTIPQQISDGTNVINLNSLQYIYTFNGITQSGTPLGPLTISTGTLPTSFNIGTYSANAVINATDATNSSNKISQNVAINFVSDFCSNGENGTDLSITRADISNNDGDDTEWMPLDSISIKVEVSNDGTESVKSTYVELGLIDSSGKNIINNMDNLAEKKIKIGTLSDGKSITKTFTFNVPVDFNEETYKLVAKAYSTDKGGQKALCIAHSSDLESNYYQSITGSRETDENRQVIVDNVILSPETAQCGDTVQLSGEVANIGDTDYEDKIKVTLINKDLKINEIAEMNTDLSEGDSTSFTIDFTIPQTAAEKTYTLEMRTYYDYDTGDDTYNLVSDKTYSKSIIVQGNCQTTPITPTSVEPTITAELDPSTPDATAGKEVIIKATIKNNDVKDTTYTISVSDNTAWSSLVSIDPKTVTIPAGQSKDVSVTLDIDSTASGNKELTIQTNYGSNQVKSQSATVVIASQPSIGLGPIGEHLAQNWFIYVIILVNLILIIAIIAVIVKMMRPRRAG